jgi:hypothetical protein
MVTITKIDCPYSKLYFTYITHSLKPWVIYNFITDIIIYTTPAS